MPSGYIFQPDEQSFLRFLSAQKLSDTEKLQLRLLRPERIEVSADGSVWRIFLAGKAQVQTELLERLAAIFCAQFSLTHAEFQTAATKAQQRTKSKASTTAATPKLADGDVKQTPKVQVAPAEEVAATDEQAKTVVGVVNLEGTDSLGSNSSNSLPEEKKLDSVTEGTDSEAYQRAYNKLYGKKRAGDFIWGKGSKAKVRTLAELTEEENNVAVEGTFVKSIDRDGKLIPFVEREMKSGAIVVTFNLNDATGGIFVKTRFENKYHNDEEQLTPREACEAYKSKLKPGMRLRVYGHVAPDRFADEELMLQPTGIQILPNVERLDQAATKRVELHCHTKMSKMDGLTDMEALVKQAIKWGHKALAITDHGVVQAFPFCFDAAAGSDLKLIFGMEGYLVNDRNFGSELYSEGYRQKYAKGRGRAFREPAYFHIIILAQNEIGLRNLYNLVTLSHLRYYNKRPLLPREVLIEQREGLLLGSACEAGELYRAMEMGAPEEVLEQVASFYDYLEIQPTDNNNFLVREGICTQQDLENNNRRIVELGKKLGKLTVATCDVHFLNPEDALLRTILQAGYDDADFQPPLYLHTTEEMLSEFAYLGAETAYEVVVANSNKIADLIERLRPVPERDQLYAPTIPGVEQQIRELAYKRAHALYGDELPQLVEDRLQLELESIIRNGYAVLYYIAHKLVTHSLERGYLVGSRGSVGSSFVAAMIDITEVNALKPHYRCPKCRYTEFFLNNDVDSGFDLPPKDCPKCAAPLARDGHDIPFAVFMGFHGDKVPDIDLNFSGDDQAVAHKYTEELFGRDNVCRAGTISTIAVKSAIGYVLKYFERIGKHAHPAQVAALAAGIDGAKRTTGQHPGGIMVVPRNLDINYITPMNRPADDKDSPIVTTHYDYHSINDRLVKLDILGHDDPTMIRMLEELTGVKARDIPVGDPETMQIFIGTEVLGVTPEQIFSEVGTLGIPECGTGFVRKMIADVKPKKFSEIVRVSGYSHGTDVWLNNAQNLLKTGKHVKETISTRDDVMTHLIAKGVEPLLAFKTMEYVRKGQAAKHGLEPEMREAMLEKGIPGWYVQSCEKIQYLFPKAHAVAYVLMGYRIAYWKVHYPREYYAAYFSKRAPRFDMALVGRGKEFIKQFIKNVYAQGFKASDTDRDSVIYLELVNEFLERGFEFAPMDIYQSDASDFLVTEKGLRPPFTALNGIGPAEANAIVQARRQGGEFISQEDLRQRSGISKAVIEKLALVGVLDGLPAENQGSLF